MSTIVYTAGADLPDLVLTWRDSSDALIDFATGHTFTVKVGRPGSTALVTKTTGITGAATAPNVTIAWSTTDLASLTAGIYTVQVVARRTVDSKDRFYPAPIALTIRRAIT